MMSMSIMTIDVDLFCSPTTSMSFCCCQLYSKVREIYSFVELKLAMTVNDKENIPPLSVVGEDGLVM